MINLLLDGKVLSNKIKDEFKIPKDKFIVLGVGQTQTRKGVIDFAKVAKDNPNIYFVWAGGFSFGGERAGGDGCAPPDT